MKDVGARDGTIKGRGLLPVALKPLEADRSLLASQRVRQPPERVGHLKRSSISAGENPNNSVCAFRLSCGLVTSKKDRLLHGFAPW